MSTVNVYEGGSQGNGGGIGELAVWIGQATTVDGVVSLHPTTDNDPEGPALFARVMGVIVTPNDCPMCHAVPMSGLKSVSEDMKTVECAVARGNTSDLLGAHPVYVPDGTPCTVMILGIQA